MSGLNKRSGWWLGEPAESHQYPGVRWVTRIYVQLQRLLPNDGYDPVWLQAALCHRRSLCSELQRQNARSKFRRTTCATNRPQKM